MCFKLIALALVIIFRCVWAVWDFWLQSNERLKKIPPDAISTWRLLQLCLLDPSMNLIHKHFCCRYPSQAILFTISCDLIVKFQLSFLYTTDLLWNWNINCQEHFEIKLSTFPLIRNVTEFQHHSLLFEEGNVLHLIPKGSFNVTPGLLWQFLEKINFQSSHHLLPELLRGAGETGPFTFRNTAAVASLNFAKLQVPLATP